MFERVFVRGDCHGQFGWIKPFCQKYNTTKDRDIIILLGDSGILYPNNEHVIETLRFLSRCPVTFLCVRGNHEDRPANRREILQHMFTYKVMGSVYMNVNYDNVLFADEGEEYYFCDKTFLTIGGAYSVDKFYRLSRGWNWYADEELNLDERTDIFNRVAGKHFDYVLTHTCPYQWEPTDLFIRGLDQDSVSKTMEYFLKEIERVIFYDHWYFGHFHADRDNVDGNGKATMLLNEIRQII